MGQRGPKSQFDIKRIQKMKLQGMSNADIGRKLGSTGQNIGKLLRAASPSVFPKRTLSENLTPETVSPPVGPPPETVSHYPLQTVVRKLNPGFRHTGPPETVSTPPRILETVSPTYEEKLSHLADKVSEMSSQIDKLIATGAKAAPRVRAIPRAKEIQGYLQEHGPATTREISTGTGIPVRSIRDVVHTVATSDGHPARWSVNDGT